MRLADDIKNIYAKRDEAIAKAEGKRVKAHLDLQADWESFTAERNESFVAKAAKLQEDHLKAEADELAEAQAAIAEADAAVDKLSKKAMEEAIAASTPKPVKETPPGQAKKA